MKSQKQLNNDDDVPPLWWLILIIIFGLLVLSLSVHSKSYARAGRIDGMDAPVAQIMEQAYLLPTSPPFLVRGDVLVALAELPPIMLRVAGCESGLNPQATNEGSQAKGLFQVIPKSETFCEKGLKKPLNMFNPQDNAECAKYLLNHFGLSPWNASKHC